MRIQLSDHFTYRKLLKFTLPAIVMMIVTSIYSIVDGFFVSNYAGKTEFTAVNFIMPYLMILGAIGFMFGTGGSAIIAKTIGEGNREKANGLFSLFIYITLIIGIILAIGGIAFLRPVAYGLGARGQMLDYCVQYGRIILIALPCCMLQFEFQSFFATAEKPQLGLFVTLGAGITNMILDFILVAVFPFGVVGAAVATALSQFVGGFIPFIYFIRPNNSLLKLTRASYDLKSLAKACTNGSSELMSNIAMSLVGMLYQVTLIDYAGNDGVAAYGVLMYVSMIFMAAFIGYSVGTAPVISYHFGAKNHRELKSLLRKSLVIISCFSLSMFAVSELLSKPMAQIFVGYDANLLSLTTRGFFIYSFSFLLSGFAIFGSGFFTALNNGLISALISFLRTLVFQVAAVLLIPLILGIDGIWVSIVVAEIFSVLTTAIFLLLLRKKYNY